MDALTSYGLDPTFERAVVAYTVTSSKFYGLIGRYLLPDYLRNSVSRYAVEACHAIFRDTGQGPGSSALVVQRLQRWSHGDGKVPAGVPRQLVDYVEDAYDAGLPEEAAVVAEMRPVLQQVAGHAVVEAALTDFQAGGDYERAAELIAEQRRIGIVDSSIGTGLGPGVFDEIDKLSNLERLPLGFDDLDAQIGGLPSKAVGVLLGPSGSGKSIALDHITAVGLRLGLHVGYVTLELPAALIKARTVAALTATLIDDVVVGAELSKKRLAELYSDGLGYLHVKDMPPGSTTVDDLGAWVTDCNRAVTRPMDLLVADYADRLTVADKSTSGYHAGRIVFDGLVDIASNRDMRVWTASQATRRKNKKHWIDLDDTADSMEKIRLADLVVSLNPVDRPDGMQDVAQFVCKNRHGAARMVVGPIPADYAFGRLCSCDLLEARWRGEDPYGGL